MSSVFIRVKGEKIKDRSIDWSDTTKEDQKYPQPQEVGGGREGLPSRLSREHSLPNTLISDVKPPEM